MKTIFNKIVSLGQKNIKDLSITQNGTVTVHTTDDVAVPHATIENAIVEMGHGEIMVSKKIKKNVYCGPRTKKLHDSDITRGKSSVVLDKGRIIAVHIHAECNDVVDLLAAIYEAGDKIAEDDTLKDRDFRSEADLLDKSYTRDKAAYDRSEAKRVKALEKQEEADRCAIRAELRVKSEE